MATAIRPRRQPGLDRTPGLAAVGRLEEATPRATRAEGPGETAELPHAGVEDLRILGIDRQVRAAGVAVDEEGALPGLAAVGRLVDPALVVAVPEVAGGADPDGVAVARVNGDPGDVLAVLEPRLLPGVAAVGRLVEPVADRDAVSDPRLAGPHPDGLRILGIGGDGADRLHLLVEDRPVGKAAVDRLPDTAARRADVDRQRAVGDRLDRRDAAAGLGRA